MVEQRCLGRTHPPVRGAGGRGRADGVYFSEEFVDISSLTRKLRSDFLSRDGERVRAHRCSCPQASRGESDAISSPPSAISNRVQMLLGPAQLSINSTGVPGVLEHSQQSDGSLNTPLSWRSFTVRERHKTIYIVHLLYLRLLLWDCSSRQTPFPFIIFIMEGLFLISKCNVIKSYVGVN